jgi:hypothetical protein
MDLSPLLCSLIVTSSFGIPIQGHVCPAMIWGAVRVCKGNWHFKTTVPSAAFVIRRRIFDYIMFVPCIPLIDRQVHRPASRMISYLSQLAFLLASSYLTVNVLKGSLSYTTSMVHYLRHSLELILRTPIYSISTNIVEICML